MVITSCRRRIVSTLLLVTAIALVAVSASGRQREGGSDPAVVNDRAGFEAIFDGVSMRNWDGDPTFWRVENRTLVGESTRESPLSESNTFLIWRGGEPADFELKLEYRINAANSGIQYRSAAVPEAGRWVLEGYQADIDVDNVITGQLYEERGRGFLTTRGQVASSHGGDEPSVIGSLESGEALKAYIKTNEWTRVHIIARGNTLLHIVNGHVMSVAIDDDVKNRASRGLIGFQLHAGPPMKVEFRNVWLKTVQE